MSVVSLTRLFFLGLLVHVYFFTVNIALAADPVAKPAQPGTVPPATASTPPAPTENTSKNKEAEEKDRNLTPGVVASSGQYKNAASQGTAGTDAPGDKPNPVLAQIIKGKNNSCAVEVTNTSEKDSYSANFEVVGRDNQGKQAFRQTFSTSLGPKKSQLKQISSCRSDLNMEVSILKGRRTN